MKFSGIVKTSTVDYPGQLSAVLFVPGCNYDCFYCQNRYLLTKPMVLDNDEIETFLKKRAGLLDGIVISGGEPTLMPNLESFASKLKEMGYLVKLDTNGSRPEVVKKLLEKGCIDYVSVDYKAPWPRYKEVCGVKADPSKVRQTLKLLTGSPALWETRTTVIPQLSGEDLLKMAEDIDPALRFALQIYRKPVNFKPEDKFRVNAEALGEASLISFSEQLKKYQPNLVLRV